ncbi:hypothetical protein Pelo_5368 [Pelomyxa schiedti]|nr:hypothetical protein Pelo_5368 [Pelomyxa schiedti]
MPILYRLVGPVKHYPVTPRMLKDLSPFTEIELLSGVYIAVGLFRKASWKDHCWTDHGGSFTLGLGTYVTEALQGPQQSV